MSLETTSRISGASTESGLGCLVALGLFASLSTLLSVTGGDAGLYTLLVFLLAGLAPLAFAVNVYHRSERRHVERLREIGLRRRLLSRLRGGSPIAVVGLLDELSLDAGSLRRELESLWKESFFAGAVSPDGERIAVIRDAKTGLICPFCGVEITSPFVVVQTCPGCAADLFPTNRDLRCDEYCEEPEGGGQLLLWGVLVVAPTIIMVIAISQVCKEDPRAVNALRHALLVFGTPSVLLLWLIHRAQPREIVRRSTGIAWNRRDLVGRLLRGTGIALFMTAWSTVAGATGFLVTQASPLAFLQLNAMAVGFFVVGMWVYGEGYIAGLRIPVADLTARRRLLSALRASPEAGRSVSLAGLGLDTADLPGHLDALCEQNLISAWLDGRTGEVRNFLRRAASPTDCPGCAAPFPKLGGAPSSFCEACGTRLYHRETCDRTGCYPNPVLPSYSTIRGWGYRAILIGFVFAISEKKTGVKVSASGVRWLLLAVPTVYWPAFSWLERVAERLSSDRIRTSEPFRRVNESLEEDVSKGSDPAVIN